MKFIINFLKNIVWTLYPKKIYGLVGGPGTGKSFRAFLVAGKNNIQYIIDDGLLLKEQKIIAGKSAKEEKFHVAAVKRAIFQETKHAREVRKKLYEERFVSLLILATSENMLFKITERLHLPKPNKVIKIEDIATEDEIKQAQRSRYKEGKHVIPIPVLEVRKNYPSIVLNAIHMFSHSKKGILQSKQNKKHIEKTIVRPAYGFEGKISISEEAILQMVSHCIAEYSKKIKILKVKLDETSDGYIISIDIAADYSIHKPEDFAKIQSVVKDKIEKFTNINIPEVNIEIKKTTF